MLRDVISFMAGYVMVYHNMSGFSMLWLVMSGYFRIVPVSSIYVMLGQEVRLGQVI